MILSVGYPVIQVEAQTAVHAERSSDKLFILIFFLQHII